MMLSDYLRFTEEIADGKLDDVNPESRELIAAVLQRALDRLNAGNGIGQALRQLDGAVIGQVVRRYGLSPNSVSSLAIETGSAEISSAACGLLDDLPKVK